HHWDSDDGLPSHTIHDIEQDSDGYLWLATTAGLIRFDGHRFTVFDQRNAGLTNPRVAIIQLETDGGIRVMTDDGLVLESAKRDPPRFSLAGSLTHEEQVRLAAMTARFVAEASALASARPGWTATLTDRFGHVWLRSADAVEARASDGSLVWSHTFPTGTMIRALTEDAEGDIWIGTITDGLYRIRPVALRVYGESSGIEDTGVKYAAPSDDGSMLLVSSRGDVYMFRDDRAVAANEGSTTTYRDRHGRTWILRRSRGPDNTEHVQILGPGSE